MHASSAPAVDAPADKLDEAGVLLEKQLEEMLEFQREVVSQCVFVRGKTKELRHGLAERQAALALEIEKREAAQRKHAEEVARMQNALQRERSDRERVDLLVEHERAKRERSETQLATERGEWQQQAKAQEESLKKAQDRLDVQSRLLQTHAAAILKLRREVETLEAQKREAQQALGKAREELAQERKARLAAEQQAEPAAAQTSLRLPSLLFRRLAPKKTHGN